ncbi:MAG: Crp/Fnr family transcriptional regulator [Acidimicrobiia bacterium]
MDGSDFHLRWLARYFGRPDYLPLATSDVQSLARAGDVVHYETDTYLYREGQDAEATYIIQSGLVELYRNTDRPRRLVARLGPGAVIGDIEVFVAGTYMSSARAAERTTAYRLPRDAVIGELAEHPRIALRWLVAALRQLDSCQRRVVLLLRKSVRARVADLLLEEADEEGRAGISQDQLAHLLGVSRPAVSRAMGELRMAGIVSTGRNLITILDSERARLVAEQ